ncbi:MAG: RsmD family RNA methyltransferase, partial [Alphaproteobacteria bacterium]
MRIIAGKYGGRRLHVPKDQKVRPTTDRVREALFSALATRLDFEETHVLDAFAGTGALGLEALSRGARTATFMDNAPTSL